MTLSATRRFIYSLLAAWYITIFALTLLNLVIIDLFIVLAFLELLFITQLTKPFHYKTSWRRHLTFFISICLVGVVIIIFQHMLAAL